MLYYRPKDKSELLPGVEIAEDAPNYPRRINQYALQEWDEIHHTNIKNSDLTEWFDRFEFMIGNVVYTEPTEEFEQKLFWERLKS